MDRSATHARSDSRLPLLPYSGDASPPASPTSRSWPRRYMLLHKRRPLLLAVFCLTLVALAVFSLTLVDHASDVFQRVSQYVPGAPPPPPPPDVSSNLEPDPSSDPSSILEHEEESYSPLVHGPPTLSYKDNLRNDTKYITSWISAGWTNDVMTYANLIYLGILTERVPIIAMFTPSHIGGDAEIIPFGEVFDVPRFIQESGVQILEWDEVKDSESDVVDDLGCWNIWEAVQYDEHHPRNSNVPDWLNIDISYTKAPSWVKLIPDYPHDKCSPFWALARLGFPQERAKNIGSPAPSPKHQSTLDPDDHLLCYDYVYYACASQSQEYDYDYAPQWRQVARYFRWTKRIESIVKHYVRQVLELPPGSDVPPYIAVHVRHGDFKNWCWGAEQPEDCFAPLSAIARRVREVQDELRERKGVDIPMSRVIITSDETDPVWWDEVRALGWKTVDHEKARTVETLGRWYPVLLDAAIQSTALGFVGTDRSTYSILSRRRVETWHDGATRTVLWGYKGADDH